LAWLWRSLSPIGKMFGKADKVAALLRLQQQLRRSPVACRLLFRRRQAAINAELLNAQIPWLKMPLLVLQSEQDPSVNTALNQTYATAPQAILRMMPAPYPKLLSEAPGKVASEISGFISANR
jgi:pimeloyl-ACP methyl ester carboxylesterase